MNGNGKSGRTSPRLVPALAVALACGLLSATPARAEKGGKTPPPPQPPAGWEVIILQPAGEYYYDSHAFGTSGGQHVGHAFVFPAGVPHACLWNGTAESWVDLNPAVDQNPAWPVQSRAYGVWNGLQVGYVHLRGDNHAALWSGTAESWVDLHPAGAYGALSSVAYGIGDGQQVGQVGVHASLWTGTAESWVDLHPLPFDPAGNWSRANGVSGGQQVGYVAGAGMGFHASLWSGTPESWVDLEPRRGTGNSRAYDVSDGQQVGYVRLNQGYHASLWSGTAESWVDLHPKVAESTSEARGVSRGYQAGFAIVKGEYDIVVEGDTSWHAGIWNGTAESWVDLRTLLPPDSGHSCAEDIEVTSTDIWVVGWASRWGAVLWHKRLSE